MEANKIVEKFDGKTILITGATGFLAKILVEKILRVQPNIKTLFLLIRAPNVVSAEQRLHQEIVDTELFRVLRDKLGENITTFLSSKIIPVSGDVSKEKFGIGDAELIGKMYGEIDFIINSAATTRFDERYDDALDINAFGAMHILNFAKKCTKLKLLLHVSTAYVHGTRSGVIVEKPFRMGETLQGAKLTYLDLDAEKKLLQQTKTRLHSHNIPNDDFIQSLRDFGIQRAILHGWPNTYSFTKAMGEMVFEKFKENVNVVIVRPPIITSTCREPFPGWMEGLRTLDSIFVSYAKRKIKFFLGDPDSVLDVIPGDMVVNGILVAMAAHDTDKPGNPINVGKPATLSSMASFHRHISIRYLPFLKVLKVLNALLCNRYESSYTNAKRKINHSLRLAELYKPYLFFRGIYDDANAENLRTAMKSESDANAEMFDFDPKSIQWEEYFINTHFPGIVKYVLKK
ncbi:PREDICTED: fatty acyl-CoA reductase 1-like isoform X2 [Erythranthe guttata]|uniref:fatty acyl-CoA reductase 1-like isoform X2 n=1 Tax=Erythranthe guttata TaxID=4155 RepID=UPI00064D8AAC|nr:PREDICTED: fatty acyl-CoA reductase 1-like isoform X2 [Erythranthe guttata]|eukprot:XP_012838538.1 PREDICTED: fatty acyl-CoA reductase 1-like isoform X2 [Erythranthe guttata]